MSSGSRAPALLPSQRTKQSRVCHCRSDLLRNGIDLAGAGRSGLRRTVRQYLDYFQLMLGYDATPAEIVALWERTGAARAPGTTRRGRPRPPERSAAVRR